MSSTGSWSSPGSTRGDASRGSSPGSGENPPSHREPWAWLSHLCTATQIHEAEQLGWTEDREQEGVLAGGEGSEQTDTAKPGAMAQHGGVPSGGCHQRAAPQIRFFFVRKNMM